MREFVTQYSEPLRLASFILGAFSIVFGGRVLGRFSGLTKPGGLYSTLLVAIPAGIFGGVSFYVYDAVTNHFPSQLINTVLGTNFNIVELVAANGILLGFLPVLAVPGYYRLGVSQQEIEDSVTMAGAFLSFIPAYFLGVLGVATASSLVFQRFGWFGGYHLPLWVILVAGAYLPLFYFVSGFLKAYTEDGDGGTLLVVTSIVSLVLSGISLLLGLAGIVYLVILTHQFGWAVPLFLVLGFVWLFVLRALGWIANRLSTTALTSIFAAPGAIAVVIQYALANIDSLPK